MAQLVDAYVAARAANAPVGPPPAEREALERTLAGLCARGRAAHPELAVEDVVFAAHLGRCGAAVEGASADDVHAEDLYLACAGLLGDETAVRELREKHRHVLANALRRLDSSPSFFDEVEQHLWDAALIGGVDAAPKLASYSGRGLLAGWLGVAAQRIAISIHRQEAAEKRALDNVAAAEAGMVRNDPELAFVKEHLREPFQRAIISALNALDDRQRLIYSLHLVSGLTLDRIAAIYRVNRSTVTRWMAGARAAIVAEAQRLLHDGMHVSPEEFDSLARLLTSQLDLSVSSVLAKPA